MESGIVSRLVFFLMSDDPDISRAAGESRQGTLKSRAATALRNLCHTDQFNDQLKALGVPEALSKLIKEDKVRTEGESPRPSRTILRLIFLLVSPQHPSSLLPSTATLPRPSIPLLLLSQDPATRINAAVALACLIGKEEAGTQGASGSGAPVLDQALVCQILEVLNAAAEGRMAYGTFWTVWKLVMGLSALSVPDGAKEMILDAGGAETLATVLFGRHHDNEKAQR